MAKIEITEADGVKASGEDRATRYLQAVAVMNGQAVPTDTVSLTVVAKDYMAGIIADLLELAETYDLDVDKVLKNAAEEFNCVAYRPIEITVTGTI